MYERLYENIQVRLHKIIRICHQFAMSVLKSLSLNYGNERIDVSYKVNFEMKHT